MCQIQNRLGRFSIIRLLLAFGQSSMESRLEKRKLQLSIFQRGIGLFYCASHPCLALFHLKYAGISHLLFLTGVSRGSHGLSGPLPSTETRYTARQPNDTSGTFHGTPWLWGEPFSPAWPGPIRDGPVPQETCASADPAGPAAGGPESKPQVS